MLGAGAGEDIDVAAPLDQCCGIHRLDLGAGHRGAAVADAQHPGNGGGGNRMVAGDHRHPDAARMAFCHGFDSLLARRIEEADQPQQHEVGRQIVRPEVARPQIGVRLPRQRQHPLTLPREVVRCLHPVVAIERRPFVVAALLPVAMLDDLLGCALDQEDAAAAVGAVQRRHVAVLGF